MFFRSDLRAFYLMISLLYLFYWKMLEIALGFESVSRTAGFNPQKSSRSIGHWMWINFRKTHRFAD